MIPTPRITVCVPGHADPLAEAHPVSKVVRANVPDPLNIPFLLHTWRCTACGKEWIQSSPYMMPGVL